MKALLLYAVAQDQGSFVSRDGETTLNYPGGFQALLPSPVKFKLTIEPLTKEIGGGGRSVALHRHLLPYPSILVSSQLVCLQSVRFLDNVSFSYVCLVIDHKFRHNIVTVAVDCSVGSAYHK